MTMPSAAPPSAPERPALTRAAIEALAPGDAEARLRWMLELSARDLSRIGEDEWTRLQCQLVFIVTRMDWAGRPMDGAGRPGFLPPGDAFPVSTKNRRGFTRILQPQLRALFRALVEEGRHEVHLPRHGAGHWVISRRGVAAEAHFLGYTWLQIILLAVRLLDQVGAQRLRACPTSGCGRIFLASRRQKYCTIEHAQGAAWSAYIARQGGTRAKGETQNVPANVPASTRKGTRSASRHPTRKTKTPR